MDVQILQVLAVIVGSTLLGCNFGWMIGLGIGLIAYALMPYQQN